MHARVGYSRTFQEFSATVSNFGCDSLTLIILEYIEITAYLIMFIFLEQKCLLYSGILY